MNRKTTSKGQQEANPEMTMLVYREMSYPAREVHLNMEIFLLRTNSFSFLTSR